MNEYTIDANGVTLNGGRTWQDADHLNVRTESGTTNFHAEAKCAAVPTPPECSTLMQAAASRIGESFIPWSDLGIDPASCIEWVQFSRANYHYGEAGEEPLCLSVTEPEPEPEPQPANESRVVESDGAPDCESLTVPVTATREEAGYYLGDDGQWHLGEYVAVDAKVWSRPATPDECPSVPAPKPGEPVDTAPVVDVVAAPAEVSTDAPVSARPVSDGLATTGADPTVGLVLALLAIVAGGSALLRKVVK